MVKLLKILTFGCMNHLIEENPKNIYSLSSASEGEKMKEKAIDGRLIQFRIPNEIALKMEVEASAYGLSIHQFCKKKALGEHYQDTQKQIYELHKMVSYLFEKSN